MCGLILFPSAVFLFWGGFALCSQLNALNIWMWLRLRQNLIWSLCRIFMFSDSFHLLNLSSQERKRKRQTNVYGTCKNERKSAILWSCLHCLIMIHFWTHFFFDITMDSRESQGEKLNLRLEWISAQSEANSHSGPDSASQTEWKWSEAENRNPGSPQMQLWCGVFCSLSSLRGCGSSDYFRMTWRSTFPQSGNWFGY